MNKSVLLLAAIFVTLPCAGVSAATIKPSCAQHDTSLVPTPFGVTERSDVIYINHQQKILVTSDNSLRVINRRTGRTVRIYRHAGSGLFHTPSLSLDKNNPLSARSLHGYLAMAFIDKVPSSRWPTREKPGARPLILSFSTDWQVPLPPMSRRTRNPDFLWNGIQGGFDPPGRVTFAQPVMSWDDRKNSYCLQNWGYVNGVLIGGEKALVTPGTRLHGVVEFKRINQDTGKYEYVSRFKGYPALDLDVDGYLRPNIVEEVFEPYSPTEPYAFPGSDSVLMYHIHLVTRPAFTSSRLDWTIHGTGVTLPSGKPNTEIISDSATDGKIQFNWH